MATVINGGDKPEPLYQMGRYYQGQNRYDLALAAYQRALAADDGFVEARNGMGVIYSRQGKYREAIEAFQAAIQQAPKAAHIYSNLGYAYYLLGQYGESVAALKQAVGLEPENQRALNNLSLAYEKAGNRMAPAQALAQVPHAPAVTPATAGGASHSAPPRAVESVPDAAAVSVQTNIAPVTQFEVRTLALPVDMIAVRPATAAPVIPVVASSVQLVQLSPNVYEIQDQNYQSESVQVAGVADIPSTAKVRVEVSNGNGVTGMAGKVGKFLHGQGYPAARLTNQKPYQARVTQIQYREGHLAEAQRLQARLPGAAELVLYKGLRVDVGVRVVLGKDMAVHLAYFEGSGEVLKLAQNVSET